MYNFKFFKVWPYTVTIKRDSSSSKLCYSTSSVTFTYFFSNSISCFLPMELLKMYMTHTHTHKMAAVRARTHTPISSHIPMGDILTQNQQTKKKKKSLCRKVPKSLHSSNSRPSKILHPLGWQRD